MRAILAKPRSESRVWWSKGHVPARARLRRVHQTTTRTQHGGSKFSCSILHLHNLGRYFL